MKNLFFAFVLLCGVTYSSNAQIAINNTLETWIVSYQNVDTPIPPGIWPFTLGTNTSAGIGVMQASNPNFCNHKFPAPGTWISTCSFFTNNVVYSAPIISPFFPPIPAIFTFN